MYERRDDPLLPRRAFASRVVRHALGAGVVLVVALAIGMLGYHHFEAMSWTDSYVNAAMILSGMGPLGDLKTESGKVFAGTYAIFSGVLFLTCIGFFLAPVLHRFFHYFHTVAEKSAKSKPPSSASH